MRVTGILTVGGNNRPHAIIVYPGFVYSIYIYSISKHLYEACCKYFWTK